MSDERCVTLSVSADQTTLYVHLPPGSASGRITTAIDIRLRIPRDDNDRYIQLANHLEALEAKLPGMAKSLREDIELTLLEILNGN